MNESRTLKDWLLLPLGKSDALADYLERRRVRYRCRPVPDLHDWHEAGDSVTDPAAADKSSGSVG